MSALNRQSGDVPPSSTPNAALNTNPMSAMSPFAAHFQEQRGRKKSVLMRHIDRTLLSNELVACVIVVLLIGVSVISFSIRVLVDNYMLQKTDTQLSSQSQLVVNNINLLSKNDSSGPNSYFLQIQYIGGIKDEEGSPLIATPLMPQTQDGIASVPILPIYGDTNGITLGQAFTTQAVVKQIIAVQSDSTDNQNDPANGNSNSFNTIIKVLVNLTANANHAAIVATRVSQRVLPTTLQQDGKDHVVMYVGLSLADQIDAVSILTRYYTAVGIAVVLFSGSLSTLIIQHTMTPLRRIERTAAKAAAGNLDQCIPPVSENAKISSLTTSLNSMLTRIESSFHEQKETTDRMKRFAPDVSHKPRAPLAAIHGYAELYKMQCDMPDTLGCANEPIEHIGRSSQRMTVLVEDLLSSARLDEGHGIDTTGTVKLSSLVVGAIDDLHALDPDHTVRHTQISPEPARDLNHSAKFSPAEGDWPEVVLPDGTSRLHQVVIDIMGNIHHCAPADSFAEAASGVTPAAIDPRQLARMSASNASMRRFIDVVEVGVPMQIGYRYAVLRFVDHGPGVSPELRSKVFEHFYTADPPRACEKGGTGLGMAIVQSVVKVHHGFICATGAGGGDLTFTMVLSIEQIAVLEPKQSTGKTKDTKQRTPWFSSERKTQVTQPKV